MFPFLIFFYIFLKIKCDFSCLYRRLNVEWIPQSVHYHVLLWWPSNSKCFDWSVRLEKHSINTRPFPSFIILILVSLCLTPLRVCLSCSLLGSEVSYQQVQQLSVSSVALYRCDEVEKHSLSVYGLDPSEKRNTNKCILSITA